MMKATLISAVLLGLLAISVPSFAEVQNVKVSGDITVRAFHREYLDLAEDNNEATADTIDSHDEFLMTTTGINIGADLTENVSAFIRLANERDWNVDGGATGDFDVSQAYITLRELFYSPLTVKIGTQPIVWGRGFVLGSNLIPSILNAATDRNTAITANEYTDFTAFDAIRATLDLSNVGGLNLPLTADYVYIKSNEGVTGVADDVTIQGVNFSTRFDQMDSEMEAYYLNKRDKSRGAAVIAGDINEDGSVNTWGLRGSLKPVEGAYAYGEIAIQHGRSATDPTGLVTAGSGVKAWAFDLGADYTFANVAMTPKLGAEWIFWSGQDYDGAVSGWDPIARGYFTSAIREFHIGQTAAGFYITDQPGDTSAATNQHQLGFYGSLKPLEDLTVAPRLSFFWLDRGAVQATGGQNERRNYAGAEWDTQVSYDYTEDVQFGLLYAVFWPGTVYDSVADDNHTAQQLVSTISLKF